MRAASSTRSRGGKGATPGRDLARDRVPLTLRLKRDMQMNWSLYLLVLPVIAFYLIFMYMPMLGAQIAFKDFVPRRGIWQSEWVGFKHFKSMLMGFQFWEKFRNTIIISLLQLLFGFPAPIILALLLNEMRLPRLKRGIQTISYLPHFISLVVVCGMIKDFTLTNGLINDIVAFFGGQRQPMLQNAALFRPIYILSGIWQNVGWGSILYIAALAGIPQELYEAASIDGAGRMRKVWHITIPGILPTIVIMLTLAIGQLMSVGYEKIILLYNPAIYDTADVISSYVYRKGLLEFDYSFSTAVGLFNSVINFALVIAANALSRRLTETSLW